MLITMRIITLTGYLLLFIVFNKETIVAVYEKFQLVKFEFSKLFKHKNIKLEDKDRSMSISSLNLRNIMSCSKKHRQVEHVWMWMYKLQQCYFLLSSCFLHCQYVSIVSDQSVSSARVEVQRLLFR